MVAGGIAAIVVTLAWARWFPALRGARTFDPPEPAPEKASGRRRRRLTPFKPAPPHPYKFAQPPRRPIAP